jgi:hypothetical protein
MSQVFSGENKLLNSWKEIAQYLSRGVRTVQRWERDLELPVRRPHNRKRSTVIAFSSDIDQWLYRAPTAAISQYPESPQGNQKVPQPQQSIPEQTASIHIGAPEK